MQHIEHRTAVITGAGSGLGAALAVRFAAAGFQVAITDLDEDRARALLADRDFPAGSFATKLDVTSAVDWESLLARVRSGWPGLGVLINNAGVAAAGLLHEEPLDNWRWLFEIDVFGVAAGCRAFLPMLLEQDSGHIINIASFAALAGAPALANYGAAKAAVVALSESLHSELAATGIAVSVACPAFIRTGLLETMRTPRERYRRRASRWMDSSGISAADFAGRVYRAAARRRFLILTHAGSRWLWRLKRWSPPLYYALLRRNVRRAAGRRETGDSGNLHH